MPRKCYVGKCRSMYSGTDEKVTVFGFPKDNDEFNRRIRTLPNAMNNATKYTGVCKNTG